MTGTVTARDAQGDVAATDEDTVALTSTDPLAGLTPVTLVDGVGSFTGTLSTAGSQTITATHNAVSGTSNAVTVAPAAAVSYAVAVPATATAGTPVSAVVTARDPYGNLATAYSGTAHVTSSDGTATLPANTTLTSGTATVSVTLKGAGNQTVTATDTVSPSITGSQSIAVAAGPTTALTLTTLNSVVAGSSNTAIVTPTDVYGNQASPADVVHFASTDPQAILPADVAWNTVVGGFPVTLETAGPQTLTVSDVTNPSVSSSSRAVTVVPGTAHTMGKQSGDAQSAAAGHTFGAPIMVLVTDGSGNPVTGQTVVFSVPVASDSSFAGSATSSTVTDSNGVAVSGPLTAGSTPGTLTVTAAAQQVLFEPVSSGLLPRTPVFSGSSTFTETITGSDAAAAATPRTSTGVGTAPQSVTVPVPAGGSITLLDAGGNPATTVVTADGTYVLDPATGVITFVARAGFSGTATPVSYRVTDGYGQQATSTYGPVVTRRCAGQPAASRSGRCRPREHGVPRRADRPESSPPPARSRSRPSGPAGRWLTAQVAGHRSSSASARSPWLPVVRRSVKTVIHLTGLGHALATRVGGIKVTVWASVTQSGNSALSAKAPVTIVHKHVIVPPRVLFRTGSAKLTATAKHQLKALQVPPRRGQDRHLHRVRRHGRQSAAQPRPRQGPGEGGLRRPCRHGLKRIVLRHGGPPTGAKSTAAGRTLNRRVQIKSSPTDGPTSRGW